MSDVLAERNETLRERILAAARSHKASWIQLGQYLFTVHKDKLYKAWGFLTFEAYSIKELGIKQTTAAKLLKSYSFLEREEPRLASWNPEKPEETLKVVPHYESVNLLRLAKENPKFTPREFSHLREAVLDSGKEPKEVKAQVKQILEKKDEPVSEAAQKIKRNSKIKRLASFLKSARKDLESEKVLPAYLLKQISDLIGKLEDQIELD